MPLAKVYNFILFHKILKNFIVKNFNFDNNFEVTTVCKNWLWACNKLKIYFKSYYKNFKFFLVNVILNFQTLILIKIFF